MTPMPTDLDGLEALAKACLVDHNRAASRKFRQAAHPSAILALISLARRAVSADGEWRPIESAPRDGTPLLAWCVHPHARHAEDPKEWAAAVVTQWINHNGGGWTWNGMAGSFTHWQPLPAPPTALGADQ